VNNEIAILIDNGYFKQVINQISNIEHKKIDYNKLTKKIASTLKKEIYRIYFYDCPPKENEDDKSKEMARNFKRFLKALEHIEKFEIRLGKLVKRDNEYVQKGIDVLITIDLLRIGLKIRNVDVAIITGDADFVPAIKVIKDEGIKVYLFHSENKGQYADELYSICDIRYPLNKEFLSDCFINE
jgi:uncharacterized LabA/DUF88 family protein